MISIKHIDGIYKPSSEIEVMLNTLRTVDNIKQWKQSYNESIKGE